MLTAEEREIILTIADDEKSQRAFSTRLLKVAQALGVQPTLVGEGVAFDLPLETISVRVSRKATASQLANLGEVRRQKPISSPTTPCI